MLTGTITTQVCNFGPLKMWAERGLIHIEDGRDNSYESLSVRAALNRVKGIHDMLSNSRHKMHSSGQLDRVEFDRQMKMVEEKVEICRRAQEQGMPSDASARRDLVRRRPRTFHMTAADM